MTIPAATGCIEVSKDLLRTSLANCYRFQRWQGNSWSATEALDRIYFESLPPPANNAEVYSAAEQTEMRPYAMIFYGDPPSGTLTGEPASFSLQSRISIEFVQNIPEGEVSPQMIDREFGNFLGNVWRTGDDTEPGLVELSKISEQGYFRIREYSFLGPWRAEWNEIQAEGDWQAYLFTFGIGDQ